MATTTQTTTKVNIQKVGECFAADLSMLALRTRAMRQEQAANIAHDITLMAIYRCLDTVHVQLLNNFGNRMAAHVYKVEGEGHWEKNRPGENNWPSTPSGYLDVTVFYSDLQVANELKKSGRLLNSWTRSDSNTDYAGMKPGQGRQYSSGSYGWTRKSYSA
ncbi:MAG: hypothetical protein ACR2PR_00150 [Pseudohongiellaceae bacterium]